MKLNPMVLKISFFFWSLGPFLVALKNIRFRRYHSIILLFAFIYGYSVYVYEGDISRYKESFESFSRAELDDYWDLLMNTYSGKDYIFGRYGVVQVQPDIYAMTMQFIVSRFTENARWFFAVVSLIYTYVFLKFVDAAVSEITWVRSLPQKIFFAFMLLIVPFYVGVTGIRFWTALFLFMFFAIKYIKNAEVKYFIGAAVSILIHYSFFMPVCLLFICRIINVKRMLSVLIMMGSIIFFMATSNQVVLDYIQKTLPFLGESKIAQRVESYSEREYIEERAEKAAQRNWYVVLKEKSIIYLLSFLFILEQLRVLRYKDNEITVKLYPFYVIFFITTMLTFNLGSIGRFQYVFYLVTFLRYSVLSGVNPGNQKLKLVSFAMLPVLLLHVLVSLRAGFYTVDPLLLVGNPLVLYFYQSDISLSEFIVGH